VYKRKRASKAVLEVLYENKNLRSAAAVHFTADEEWRLAEESVGPLNGVVIPLGVEIRDADALQEPGSFRDYYPQLANRPYLLFLGRINYKKGLDILISAFGVLIRRYPELRLVIAGPDNEAFLNQVMVWIREQEVQASVLIVGMLQGKRKLQAFRDAVAFVLPSYSENFGMAVVEAMACGTPVVISDRVNIARRLNELEAAIVVNCDPTELAAALSRLMEDRTLRDRLSRVGRAAVEAEYSWATVGERLDQLYSRIVCGISSQT
jgi:glycosyltransferase involved in cell wall biosynthesis